MPTYEFNMLIPGLACRMAVIANDSDTARLKMRRFVSRLFRTQVVIDGLHLIDTGGLKHYTNFSGQVIATPLQDITEALEIDIDSLNQPPSVV